MVASNIAESTYYCLRKDVQISWIHVNIVSLHDGRLLALRCLNMADLMLAPIVKLRVFGSVSNYQHFALDSGCQRIAVLIYCITGKFSYGTVATCGISAKPAQFQPATSSSISKLHSIK